MKKITDEEALRAREINPYFEAWARIHGHDPYAFTEEGEPVVDSFDGRLRPWNRVFVRWIQRQWRQWGEELGFRDRNGLYPHELALRSGHTRAEFGEWLAAKVPR